MAEPDNSIIDIATDDLGSDGYVNKAAPDGAILTEGYGKQSLSYQHLNYIVNNHAEWLTYLNDEKIPDSTFNKIASSVLINTSSLDLSGSVLSITDGYFHFTNGYDNTGLVLSYEEVASEDVDFTDATSDTTYWIARTTSATWEFRETEPVFDMDTGLYDGETEALSFLKHPVTVVSGFPTAIDTTQTLAENVIRDVSMTAVEIDAEEATIEDATIEDANITNAVITDTVTGTFSYNFVTGEATFTNSDNNISLTGVGSIYDLAVGDFIEVSGTTSNDGYYTVETITDTDNIIVNAEHAGGTTTKSLTDEASVSGVTIKMLSKSYNVANGSGQGWVDVTASRVASTDYTNSTGRPFMVFITVSDTTGVPTANLYIDSIQVGTNTGNGGGGTSSIQCIIPAGSDYRLEYSTDDSINTWFELR